MRNSFLISTDPVSVPPHGLYASAAVLGAYDFSRGLPRAGISATNVQVKVAAQVDSTLVQTFPACCYSVTFGVYDESGTQLVVSPPTSLAGRAAGSTVMDTLALPTAECWSVARPYLYSLVATVRNGSTVVDSMNITFGVRGVAWTADKGMLLNSQPVKMRGFCNHENFAGVGSAIPERVNLFRLQQMRGVGGNAWRASHSE